MTSNNIPEEFPKKLEDRICPNWKECREAKQCEHSEKHETIFGCETTCLNGIGKCIQIPELFMDNGGK